MAKRSGGFTLSEILIVVVIILALSGIAASATMRGIYSGKVTTCANNLHQIYLSLNMYWEDHDGYFPPYVFDGLDGSRKSLEAEKEFVDALKPYGAKGPVWYCPLDQYAGKNVRKALGNSLYSSYYAGFGLGRIDPTNDLWHGEIFNVSNPAPPGLGFDYSKNAIMFDNVIADDQDPFRGYTGHGNFENRLWLDGHVDWNHLFVLDQR